ncbi:MAG: hypothetical protein ACKOZY_02825 [Flavobacteriales bacterium]
MNRQDALRIFRLKPDIEEEWLMEAMENDLFETKKDILQKYMVPVLLQKKLREIQDKVVAEHILQPAHSDKHAPSIWDKPYEDRVAFLEDYEAKMSELKSALMQAISYRIVFPIVQRIILTQEYYMVLFRILFNEFSEALPEEVNSREIIDTGKLLLALKNGPLDERTTWSIEREIGRIDRIRALRVGDHS